MEKKHVQWLIFSVAGCLTLHFMLELSSNSGSWRAQIFVSDPPRLLIILWTEISCQLFPTCIEAAGTCEKWAQLLPSYTPSITPWNVLQYLWMFDCSSLHKVHSGLGAVQKDKCQCNKDKLQLLPHLHFSLYISLSLKYTVSVVVSAVLVFLT